MVDLPLFALCRAKTHDAAAFLTRNEPHRQHGQHLEHVNERLLTRLALASAVHDQDIGTLRHPVGVSEVQSVLGKVRGTLRFVPLVDHGR